MHRSYISLVLLTIMNCFRCDVIIHLFEDAQKVTVEETVCECGAQLITVEYKRVCSLCIYVYYRLHIYKIRMT